MEDFFTRERDRAAFACVDSQKQYLQQGLTKREYFAGLAMQGILANRGNNTEIFPIHTTAKRSVELADALLKELLITNK